MGPSLVVRRNRSNRRRPNTPTKVSNRPPHLKVNGQRSTVNGQRSTVNGQRSTVNGMRVKVLEAQAGFEAEYTNPTTAASAATTTFTPTSPPAQGHELVEHEHTHKQPNSSEAH